VLTPGPGPAIVGLAWNGARYVAAGSGGTFNGDPRTILSSIDAQSWAYSPLPPALNAGGLAAVTWTGSEFIAVGEFGNVLTSVDGLIWTADFTGTLTSFSTMATANGSCIAAGIFGVIMINPDCGTSADTVFRNGFDE
jgi:hypothetical protein